MPSATPPLTRTAGSRFLASSRMRVDAGQPAGSDPVTALHWRSATDLAAALDSGETSAEEIARALIARTDEIDPALGTYLQRTEERLLADARASDGRRAQGKARSRFDGVPIGYKDLFVTKDVVTTCGSRILEGWVPPYDATVVARGKAAGLPMLGKLNMD